MRKLTCLRCDAKMGYVKTEQFQLGRTGIFIGDLSNLMAGSLEMEIYSCPKCGKYEFFRPLDETQLNEDDTLEEMETGLPPDADCKIVSVSRDGMPQVRCPACGKIHDFDYPRCPHCDHPY